MDSLYMPLVSIIIPVYNAGNYIASCLQSVIEQTYRNVEIIVVNDGSIDNSLELIQKYSQLDKRIVVVNKRNQGLPLARKSGIDIAHGEYIQHLDSDDTLLNNAIELLVNRAVETNADIVAAPFYFCYPGKEPILSVPLNFDITSSLDYYREILRNRAYWSVWANFQKRSLYDYNVETIPDISFGEDAILMTQLIFSAQRIASLSVPILRYNRFPTSMSFAPNSQKYKDFRAYQLWIEEYLKNKNLFEKLQEEIAFMHLQATFLSLSWGEFNDFDKDMKRLIQDLNAYPDLDTSLSRRARKIVRAYRISPCLGHLRLMYYRKRNKL